MLSPSAKLWVPIAALGACAGGVAAFLGSGGPGMTARRPAADGAVGRVVVYGQGAAGPQALAPGRVHRLARPQELVFWFEVAGSGPRDVRIEVEAWGRRQVLFEARLEAPVEGDYLDVSLPLDERAPDRLQLTTVVEPPHMMNLETSYELRLAGPRDARAGAPAP